MTTRPRRDVAAHVRGTRVPFGLALAMTLGCALAVPALGAEPSAGPGTATLLADGAFGRVAGVVGDPGGSSPDPGTLPVLDAWARGTGITFRPSSGTLAPWHATALAEAGAEPSATIDLGGGDGDARVRLTASGLYLVAVEGTIRPDGDAIDGTWWWRVAVPDRDLPDGETGPPPPALVLASGDAIEPLEQGSGCFLGTCGDIGRVSPPDQLPTIRSIPGAPLELSLSDGSAVTDWRISARPVADTGAEGTGLGEGHGTPTTRAWVVAPGVGDWVVEVSVTFDRDRGSFDGYGRLIVEPAPGG